MKVYLGKEMKKKRRLIILLLFIVILAGYISASLYMSTNSLVVNNIQLESSKLSKNQSVRCVVLADLHDHEFGTDNKELIAKVNAQSPDIILLAGDFINDISENSEVVCTVVEALCDIAPTYFAMGNHELAYLEKHPELEDEIEACGAVIVEKSYVDTEVDGVSLRIGGIYDYAFFLAGREDLEPDRQESKEFLEDFQETDAVKIMLSHRPDSFCFNDASTDWDVDLVVSAHNHGGQVVVPFLGGLYGGDQGWFPEYVHGMYELGDMHMYVTNGLGSDKKVLPRFNNRPEIAVIEISGK